MLICERQDCGCNRKHVFACLCTGMCSFMCLQKHASAYVYLTCFWIDRTVIAPPSHTHTHSADQFSCQLCLFPSSPFFVVCCWNLLLTTENWFGSMAEPCDLFVFAFQSHSGHTDHSFSLLAEVQTALFWFHFEWPKWPPHFIANAPKQTTKKTAFYCLKDWLKEGECPDLDTRCSAVLPEMHTYPGDGDIKSSVCQGIIKRENYTYHPIPTASSIKCCQISRCPISVTKIIFPVGLCAVVEVELILIQMLPGGFRISFSRC